MCEGMSAGWSAAIGGHDDSPPGHHYLPFVKDTIVPEATWITPFYQHFYIDQNSSDGVSEERREARCLQDLGVGQVDLRYIFVPATYPAMSPPGITGRRRVSTEP